MRASQSGVGIGFATDKCLSGGGSKCSGSRKGTEIHARWAGVWKDESTGVGDLRICRFLGRGNRISMRECNIFKGVIK